LLSRARDTEGDGAVSRGYRIVVIRYDQDIALQISDHPDVFGSEVKADDVIRQMASLCPGHLN
jgi:hypothetical protein